jgi:hypothetical protein
MHTPPQFLFDGLQLSPHTVPSGFPFDLEFALASLLQIVKWAQLARRPTEQAIL